MTPKILYQFKDCAGESFRPSNGTEGMVFTDAFCDRCIHEKWSHTQKDGDKQCEILSASMIHYSNEAEYPKEWIYNKDGWPVCTNWQKWDWGDGYGGHNEPPKPPYEPNDPDQLMLFSIADEILENHKPKEVESIK